MIQPRPRLPGLLLAIEAALAPALLATAVLFGQAGSGTPLTLLSRDGQRPLPTSVVGGREYLRLDDVAAAFQLTVREEAGAVTVSARAGTIILTVDRSLASVAGRLISLSAPPIRSGGRVLVPIDFISRALAPISEPRVELRRPARLVVVGDLRVPRVTIRHEASAGASRVTIEATPQVASTVAHEDGRLTIRFEADALEVAIPAIQPQGLVDGIRRLDALTLGIDLGSRFASYRASSENAGDRSRLLVEIVSAESAATAPPPVAPPPAELTALGSRPPAIHTLVLDPGHGGDDEGAKGAGGVAEKDLTLAIARRLKALMEARLGIRVLLTRDADRPVPLDRRAALANNHKADLFLSLHANASPRPAASGASIHVAAFDDDDRARAGVAADRLPLFSGGLRDIELVPWDLAQIRHVDRSEALAEMLRAQFEGRVPLDTPSVDRGSFRVLESANMPAVLIELGYLTNAQQEKLLATANFQSGFVQAVFDAVLRFREVLEAAGGEP